MQLSPAGLRPAPAAARQRGGRAGAPGQARACRSAAPLCPRAGLQQPSPWSGMPQAPPTAWLNHTQMITKQPRMLERMSRFESSSYQTCSQDMTFLRYTMSVSFALSFHVPLCSLKACSMSTVIVQLATAFILILQASVSSLPKDIEHSQWRPARLFRCHRTGCWVPAASTPGAAPASRCAFVPPMPNELAPAAGGRPSGAGAGAACRGTAAPKQARLRQSPSAAAT